jgi:hypothetical protein
VIENDTIVRIMTNQVKSLQICTYSYRQIFFWDFSSSFLTPFTYRISTIKFQLKGRQLIFNNSLIKTLKVLEMIQLQEIYVQYTFLTLKNARNVNSHFIVQVHTSSNAAFVNKEELRKKAERVKSVPKFCENKVDKILHGGFNFDLRTLDCYSDCKY